MIVKVKKMKRYTNKHKREYLLFSIIFLIFIFPFLIPTKNNDIIQEDTNVLTKKSPKTSGWWATIDLINPAEVNDTRFPRFSTIQIKGRLYNRVNGTGKDGYTVGIEVNDIPYYKYNATTNLTGYFTINYTIEGVSLNVHSNHTLNATVIGATPDKVEYRHFYYIRVNGTSYFDINTILSDDPNRPLIPGENFHLEGHLRYDNGSGIPSQTVYRYWINETERLEGSGQINPVPLEGLFDYDFTIPTFVSKNITIKLNYTGVANKANWTQIFIPLKLFRNITCYWSIVGSATVGDQITVQGGVVSRTNNSMGIAGRDLRIYYNGSLIGSPITDLNGNFSFPYTIPTGLGLFDFQVILNTTLPITVNSSITHTISITAAVPPAPPTTPPTTPPFLDFIIIFIPIVAGIVAVLVVYGVRKLRKQEVESRSTKLPLERRIRNMKILKDTGRIEEALSYLFNAVYMDLVDAKFGRKREVNETIRDFAIVSVKELNLNPSAIYPFITKVEEMIYARPFTIVDKDFYDTVGLFSPIYYELTGSYFKLNF
jgi:hypothetical protein